MFNNEIYIAGTYLAPIFNTDSVIIYDTETTGLNKTKDRVVQFSAVRTSMPEFEITDTIDIYIKCPFSVPEIVSKINRITDEVLEEKGLSEEEAFKKISEFIHDDDIVMGFNSIRFDDIFMENMYKRFGSEFKRKISLDIMQAAKKVIPSDQVFDKEKNRPSYTQANCVAYYGKTENDFAFHSSIEDVKAANFLLKNLVYDIIQAKEAPLEEKENKPKANIMSLSFFNPNRRLQRVYVNTSLGNFYYDHINRSWEGKKGQGDAKAIDMADLRQKSLNIVGAVDDDDFYRLMSKNRRVFM